MILSSSESESESDVIGIVEGALAARIRFIEEGEEGVAAVVVGGETIELFVVEGKSGTCPREERMFGCCAMLLSTGARDVATGL